MHIAVNTRFLIKDRLEGIGWFTYETLKRITQLHPEHEFIFFFDRKFSDEFIFSKNITPVVLNPPARHPLLWYWWFEQSVPRALRKHKADLFLSPDGFTSLNSKLKNLLVVHDIAFEHFNDHVNRRTLNYYRKNTPRYCNHATRIATVSEYTKMDLVEHYKIRPEKIDVIYNGANEAYKPLSEMEMTEVKQKISVGKNYFVFVSAIQPRKNVSRIFQAFDEFKKSDQQEMKLVIAGRKAWNYDEIFHTYESMSHKSDVIFTEHLAQAELAKIVGSSTALLYPSLFEGFGIPIVEAMKAETAVITSNISSMPEVAGDAALQIDPYSIEQLVEAMKKISQVHSFRNYFVEKGKLQCKKFNWDNTASALWNSMETATQL